MTKKSKNKPQHHMILLSFDALSASDWNLLTRMPNFKRFLKASAFSNNVKSVYPSLTYPAHASIVTGRLPKKHNIISNTKVQPARKSPDWYWFHSAIRGLTLFQAAKKAKMTTAGLLWPVSGRAPITYNLPEIFANRPWLNQVAVSMYAGSPVFQYKMKKKHGHLLNALSQPELDNFVEACLMDVMEKKPHLIAAHFTELDTAKHYKGVHEAAVEPALKSMDDRLGRIIDKIEALGIGSKTTVMVIGDHGQRAVHSVIRPNIVLQKEGFQSLEENGKLHHYDFVFKSCDGSAYLYHGHTHRVTKETMQKELDIIVAGLEKNCDSFKGIANIYDSLEAAHLGADPHCLLMLEAAEGFYFLDELQGELHETVPEEKIGKNHYFKACHGYLPDTEGYDTVFMMAGYGVKPRDIGPMNLIDIGPTAAQIMGLELPGADGEVLVRALKSNVIKQ